MLGVLWPVVHITQHPEPMYPAVANTSSNSRLGDVCQSQLWPMGSSHRPSHSINSNRYLTQMGHEYPDIAFTLNWHNSRGNSCTSCEYALRLMSLDHNDSKSTLVQMLNWWCQAKNHHLSICWPRSISPYDVTSLQWVKTSPIVSDVWLNDLHIQPLQLSVSH